MGFSNRRLKVFIISNTSVKALNVMNAFLDETGGQIMLTSKDIGSHVHYVVEYEK